MLPVVKKNTLLLNLRIINAIQTVFKKRAKMIFPSAQLPKPEGKNVQTCDI